MMRSTPWNARRLSPASDIASPEASETTTAGLPKRVPRANLIPGSVGGGRHADGRGPGRPADGRNGRDGSAPAAPQPEPQRSPEMARSRLSGFQRGARRAAEGQIPQTGEGADR